MLTVDLFGQRTTGEGLAARRSMTPRQSGRRRRCLPSKAPWHRGPQRTIGSLLARCADSVRPRRVTAAEVSSPGNDLVLEHLRLAARPVARGRRRLVQERTPPAEPRKRGDPSDLGAWCSCGTRAMGRRAEVRRRTHRYLPRAVTNGPARNAVTLTPTAWAVA